MKDILINEHGLYYFINIVGAIEVIIANMLKDDRSSTEEVYVVGFVPSYQLPKARPCTLDPFLHPLITDVEDIFIDGNE